MEKTIYLEKLEIKNFKGIVNKTIEFTKETTLFGDNGTGKTTCGADALPWLFFGKNSADETKFNVKTLDDSGVRIPNIETSVKAWVNINGTQEVFERKLIEKWVKKHGQTSKEYTGDVTQYFINAAPKQKKDFDNEVGQIISQGLFKLLSNPLEFNRLPWEKRRSALIQMVGEIQYTPTDENLLSIINSGKNIDTYKTELKGKIKLHNEEYDKIPTRIDEANTNKPESLNWAELQASIDTKQNRIDAIEQAANNEALKQQEHNKKQAEIQKQIGEKELELQKLENDLKLEANKDLIKLKGEKAELESNIAKLEEAKATNAKYMNAKTQDITTLEDQKSTLLAEYEKLKEREFIFDETKAICPTCKQSLPTDEVEEQESKLRGNFNTTKANSIAENIREGKLVAGYIEQYKAKIKEAKAAIENISNELPGIKEKAESLIIEEKPVDFSMEKEWNDLHDEITKLKSTLSAPKEQPNNSELSSEKTTLKAEIKELEKQLNAKTEIEKADKRIAELQAKQNELAQLIADLEKEESIVLEYEKTKMSMLEEKVNGLFTMVKFRMFESQKNGGEKPDCVTLIDGVPYSDANTASKVNAGVDIINVLSNHYKVYVPIIVDNKESVSELLPTKGQVITLKKEIGVSKLTNSEYESITQQIAFYSAKNQLYKAESLKAKLKTLRVK